MCDETCKTPLDKKTKDCPICGFKFCLPIGVNKQYAVCCDMCHLLGPVKDHVVDAIQAWNDLPRMLCWTKDLPCKEGYYWWRRNKGQHSVVRVARHPRMESLVVIAETCLIPKLATVKEAGGEWAGPISLPKEDNNGLSEEPDEDYPDNWSPE